jgi:hypothetical protein
MSERVSEISLKERVEEREKLNERLNERVSEERVSGRKIESLGERMNEK